MSPSPIYLGATQMCEHDLAADAYSVNGGWGGGYGAGSRVLLAHHTFTVRNPNGAWIVGIADLTCYASPAGTVIYGSTTVDGGAQTTWPRFYFNNASEHVPWSYVWWHNISAGSHTVEPGIYVNAGAAYFDGNDGGTFSAWEMP